jgi:hypothetical protein
MTMATTIIRLAAAAIAAALAAGGAASCAGVKRPQPAAGPAPPRTHLWAEPSDLMSRDLYYGPWGREHAPDPAAVYTLVERKRSGVNLGMTVKDPEGREWSVKQPFPGGMDSEAPVEVVVSRLLSAVGYFQPPVYFLRSFTLEDDWGRRVEVGGRFRLKHESLKELSAWKWDDNPFVGTRPYEGLIVLLMMFNSTDLKASNNSIYEHRTGDTVEHWYVARDLGAALGDVNRIAPRKNHIESFEKIPFVLGVNGGYAEFAYSSWYANLVDARITPDDVAWACDLLGRLGDRQWHDAFRAGGFEPAVAARFVARLREKIDEGRSLSRRAARGQ